MHKITRRVTITLAAAAAAITLAAVPAMAAPACAAPTNCTNATLAVGSTIGTTGFPTSVALSGNAGTTVSAVASAYSVFSNTAWTLSWAADPGDVVTTGGVVSWAILPLATPPVSFGIPGTTSLKHNGVVYPITTGTGNTQGLAPIQIDSGTATGGGQNFADTYSVAIPTTAAPGSYTSVYNYILAG